MKFLPTKVRTYVVFCDYFETFFEANLNIHDVNLSTNLNYLSLKVLSVHCDFDVQNLIL